MDAKAIMLAIHIVCGLVALVSMMMAYLTKKGPAMVRKSPFNITRNVSNQAKRAVLALNSNTKPRR